MKREREGNYGIESAVLFEAFFQEGRLFFGEPELLSSISTVFIFIANSRRDFLNLDLFTAEVSLSLNPSTREGRDRAVRRRLSAVHIAFIMIGVMRFLMKMILKTAFVHVNNLSVVVVVVVVISVVAATGET